MPQLDIAVVLDGNPSNLDPLQSCLGLQDETLARLDCDHSLATSDFAVEFKLVFQFRV